MKSDDLQNETKILSFLKGKYYFIKNLSNNLCMTVNKDPQNQKKNFNFEKINNYDLYQIWMIEEVADKHFQIIHAFSSLALQMTDSNVKLTTNKIKNSQTFWLQKSQSQIGIFSQNVFTIKEFKNSKKYIYLDENGAVRCMQNILWKGEYNKWNLCPIKNHPLISQTCLIENYHSGLYLQVYQGKLDQGQKIVQNILNNQLHQRWQIIQKELYVIIKSFKTGFVLDIRQQKTKQGTSIIQWNFKDSLNQKWILQKHGKNIFIIRSFLDKSLMLSIKGNSLKDEGELIITKNQSEAFWRIIGNIEI